jgi:multisubunit Na+/H+ antiporter MnhE subunit
MVGALLRVAGLAAIYLLVLTSFAPGDILVGVLLAAGLVLAAGSARASRHPRGWKRWLAAVTRMIATAAFETALGSVRVMRYCLTGAGSPGFVEIRRGSRSRHGVALWGVLTGEAPDEYPVAVDDERELLVVHVIDARDPEAIRARHEAALDAYLRDVVR